MLSLEMVFDVLSGLVVHGTKTTLFGEDQFFALDIEPVQTVWPPPA